MVGVRNHEDLVAWQLCKDLKESVFAFTGSGGACRDFKFRNQIRDASCSAMDCLSEGFYRFYPKDFARFCSMTRGSLGEVKSQLRHAQSRQYLVKTEFDQIWTL